MNCRAAGPQDSSQCPRSVVCRVCGLPNEGNMALGRLKASRLRVWGLGFRVGLGVRVTLLFATGIVFSVREGGVGGNIRVKG